MLFDEINLEDAFYYSTSMFDDNEDYGFFCEFEDDCIHMKSPKTAKVHSAYKSQTTFDKGNRFSALEKYVGVKPIYNHNKKEKNQDEDDDENTRPLFDKVLFCISITLVASLIYQIVSTR